MEGVEGLPFTALANAAKKKRSSSSRRPRSDAEVFTDYRDLSSLSSTPPSDSTASSEEITGNSNVSSTENSEAYFGGSDSRRFGKGITKVSANSKPGPSEVQSDGQDNLNKVKKVKLKLGGVTRTLHAKSSDGASINGASVKSHRAADAPRPRQKLLLQESSEDDSSVRLDEVNAPGVSTKQPDKYENVRKSKRVPKRRSIDGDFDDGDDAEIQYVKKLRASKLSGNYGIEYEDVVGEGSRKQRKISGVLKQDGSRQYNQDSGSSKDGKRSRSGKPSEDNDYLNEEQPMSDDDSETMRKKQTRDLAGSSVDSGKEMAVTTRRRAFLTAKNGSPKSSFIEFPNGLPPPPPRKQKEQLTEVEQQLKRAEALLKRRQQVEKAARESEAEAIRRILGQDSSRKKRESKIKKRQEELAQEKATNAMVVASDIVRWNLGPSGTIVTFPSEVGLPSIFNSKPCSYPPPREKCAGPSCENPYKYRDSKSKLPLCSLQCYKAINNAQPVTC